MFKNWRTSLGSVIGTIGVALVASDNHTAKIVGAIITGIGMLFGGANGKDKQVSGKS